MISFKLNICICVNTSIFFVDDDIKIVGFFSYIFFAVACVDCLYKADMFCLYCLWQVQLLMIIST